jgi:hypothetical protein
VYVSAEISEGQRVFGGHRVRQRIISNEFKGKN